MSMVQTKKLQSPMEYQIANNKLSSGPVSHNSDYGAMSHNSTGSKKAQKYLNICNKIPIKMVLMVLCLYENIPNFAS